MMPVKKITTIVLTLGILGVTAAAFAQTQSDEEQDQQKPKPTIAERLDNLGKTIFGGILPADKTTISKAKLKDQSTLRESGTTESGDDRDVTPNANQRAGSILTGTPSKSHSASVGKAKSDDSINMEESRDSSISPENTPSLGSASSVGSRGDDMPKPVRKFVVSRAVSPEEKNVSAATPAQEISGISPKMSASDRSDLVNEESPSSAAGKSTARPLNERLSAFRKSVFDSTGTDAVVLQPNRESNRAVESSATKLTGIRPNPSNISSATSVTQRAKSGVDIQEPLGVEPVLSPAANAPLPIVSEKTAAALDVNADNNGGVLVTRKNPLLSVETLGPRRIAVGKESTYEVNMANSGEVAVEDLVVFVNLPEWAEVVGADASNGTAQVNAPGQPVGLVQWKLPHLDAKSREHLALRLIPRQSRPFDLAVRWEYKPIASQAMIEVQEPKFSLQLDGPREVLYGKKEVYHLKLSNVGNGTAENVTIMLMPVGAGENTPAMHKLGMLAAGEEKVLDVELTARQAGNLAIQVEAKADGGIHTEVNEKVVVRRAALKVDIDGPKVQFVGATANYAIRVRNPGTAPARNLHLSVTLPAGAKYLSGIDGANYDAAANKLEWALDAINPAAEQNFSLRCNLGTTGLCRVFLSVSADDDLATSAIAQTRIDSVANLVMEVRDPEGPTPVGEESAYEVRIRNRGTKAAENVEVFAYFSRGIEPTRAEGAPSRLGPGQVAFQPVVSLSPGEEVVYKVHAKADIAGNHVFRAEAHCKVLGSRLIREATNLYYADAATSQQVASEPAVAPNAEAMRPVPKAIQDER
jgi:uncharacterized repeat protein (TIGR01451 family)